MRSSSTTGNAAWPDAPRLDLVGFVLSIAGVAAVVYTTIEAPARGWSAPVTLAGYGAGVALLAVFAVWERRVGEPMFDITLFRNIRFSAGLGWAGLGWAGHAACEAHSSRKLLLAHCVAATAEVTIHMDGKEMARSWWTDGSR